MEKLYDLKDDIVFKETFCQNTKESYEARRLFISAVLQKEIMSCELIVNELKFGLMDQKDFRMDFSAVFNNGEMVNVEMQCVNTKENLKKRFMYYLCGMLVSQELKGKYYDSLKSCYVIMVLNFTLFEEDLEFFHNFQMRDKNVVASDLINLISIELPKLNEERIEDDYSEVEAWAYFFKNGEKREKQDIIKLLTRRYGGIKMAEESRNEISASRLEFLQKLRNNMYNRQEYYDELEIQNELLEKSVKESHKKNQELSETLEKTNDKNRELSMSLEKTNDKNRELSESLEKTNDKNRELSESLEKTNDKNRELSKSLEKTTERNKQLEEEIRALKKMLANE